MLPDIFWLFLALILLKNQIIMITEAYKERLMAINELILKEEIKAIKRYELLEQELKQMVANKTIWDYNINFKIGCFTSDEDLNKNYNTEEGDPIFEWKTAIYELLIEYKNNPSWNEVDYLRGTLLDGFQFCYTFYCILCYSKLSIEEILLIQSVWIDVSVDYQWEVKLIKIQE